MLRRSPKPTSSFTGATSLDTGRLSPVSDASIVWSAVDPIRRASAGTVSPSSTKIPSPAVAQHGRLVRGHRPQGGHRPLRPGLLNVAQNTVEQHDREDGQPLVRQGRVALVDPQPDRDRRGYQQQDDQDVLKLRQETLPGGHGLLGFELVRTVLLQARAGLLAAQPALGVAAEPSDDLLGGHSVRVCLVCIHGLWYCLPYAFT